MTGDDSLHADAAEAAAARLVAYWRREPLPDAGVRQGCSRLAELVDAGGELAAAVRTDPAAGVERVAEPLRRAAEDDAAVAALVRRLAPDLPASPPAGAASPGRRVEQNVSFNGSSAGLVVGGDFHASGPFSLSGGAAPPAGGAGAVPPQPDPAPSGDAIFLAAADPYDLEHLRLGKEEREIREALELSEERGRWAVHPWSAVRLRDMTRALLRLRPRIVHFSGHGGEEGGLYFEDESGRAHEVPPDALAGLFGALDGAVECVVLNACYSEPQARAISAHVPFVVGTPDAVSDDAAVAFSVGFYQAIGAGCGIPQAYRLGCVQMRGADTAGLPLPILIRRE